jgi:hypothetical protein
MDPKSGQIVTVKDEAEARSKGLVPIPAAELEAVQAMTDEEKKAWAKRKLQEQGGAFQAYPGNGNRRQRRAKAAQARRDAKSKGGKP